MKIVSNCKDVCENESEPKNSKELDQKSIYQF